MIELLHHAQNRRWREEEGLEEGGPGAGEKFKHRTEGS